MSFTGIIAEKRSQADSIAKAFGFKLGDGCYQGKLGGEAAKLVWARGHLFTLEDPDNAKPGANWTDPSTLIPLPKNPSTCVMKDAKSSYQNIASKMKGANRIVIATDPDREGEAIGRDILAAMHYRGAVDRAWLTQGLDARSIQTAFQKLRPGATTEPIYAAQQARNIADWQYQFVTRAYTAAGRHGLLGGHLGTGTGRASVTSTGRVQSPTVRIVVERDKEIANFVPEDHFVLSLNVTQDEHTVTLKYAPLIPEDQVGEPIDGIVWRQKGNGVEPLFVDVDACRDFYVALSEIEETDLKIAKKNGQKPAPKPLSLIDLQKAASKSAGLSSARALEIADKLYKDGVLSYPRTENAELPINIYEDCVEHLRLLDGLGFPGAKEAVNLHEAADKMPRCYVSNPGEHHGLMPTTSPLPESASKDEQAVYSLVCRRYIEAHLPPAKTAIVEITAFLPVADVLGLNPSRFFLKGETVEEPGWMAPFRSYKSETLPPMQEGIAEISRVNGSKEQTSPPAYFTEDTLLAAMKSAARFLDDHAQQKLLKNANGIGTPATRANVIETVLARGYITRKGKALRATEKAFDLIKYVDEDITSVAMTAKWEAELMSIEGLQPAAARSARDSFIEQQSERLDALIGSLSEQIKSTPRKENHAQGASGSTGKPTPKMLSLAKKLAKENGEKLPPGTTGSFDKCKAYIDLKIKSSSGGRRGAPTSKMVIAAEQIAHKNGLALPEGYQSEWAICKQFLDTYAQASRTANR